MSLQRLLAGAVCAGSILAAASPAIAQPRGGPSLHVQCDGHPDNVSDGETAARLLGAVTLLGIFAPPPEQSDLSARLYGAEGVRVCADLLTRETHDVRRAQLRLANAIHNIEARDFEAAIVQARMVPTERPALGQTRAFQLSLALSAMELEAQALLGLGRTREAADKAMEMAAAAPYDLINNLRALFYVQLTGEHGEAEQRFYANLIRLYPAAVLERGVARQMAGDFAGAADDLEQWMSLTDPLLTEPNMGTLAQAALTRALAGDMLRAEPLAERARNALRAKTDDRAAQPTGELLDLYQILATARGGNPAQARVLFAGRTQWLRPSAGAVSAVARELREGAPESELIGSLAGDPARFRAERLASLRDRMLERAGGQDEGEGETVASEAAPAKTARSASQLFSAIRPHWTDRQLTAFSANTWRSDRSRYFARSENDTLRARLVNVSRDGYGVPAGYALLLHSALVARAEGRSSFMIMPAQLNLGSQFVRTGEPGAEMPEAMTFNAERVIADLSPLIPQPMRRR